ncbi:hypothetical protein XAC3810_300023 [Xanthomonas citri pv. citri]|nr:hypothetical protein XAC9322_320122 [Xanthomonas citri pv. citri]CEE26087.1 hypothetical protein XAC1083_310121 [Xanthomonas citri pv. citri]CEE34709.1 hypothetical protein XAC3810_300023 [Xanthomonas citri pv. citri]CEE37247.1 hypothetical protein XAC902_440004 [Xanthomonas citri pv. citri]CEE37326.1 hypothetical protein XAC2911_300118 [Xanthomonas citri pv. citri]
MSLKYKFHFTEFGFPERHSSMRGHGHRY